jgi:O-antigen/teichoic acid export membrane protein
MNDEVTLARWLRIPRHLFVAASAWGSRIITALVMLASVRILLDSLGLENYAVFVLLTGLTGWFMLADMGIGVSVQNHISEARARDQPYDNLILGGGLLAVLLMLVTLCALYCISPYVAPMLLKNFPFLSEAEKTELFFSTSAISIGMGIGGIVYRIWYGEHKGYLSNIVPSIAAIIGLVGLLLVRQTSIEDRLFLSLIAFTAPLAVLPIGGFLVQLFKLIMSRSVLGHSGANLPGTIRRLIQRGFKFWLFAVMAAGVLQIDYIVMSQFLVAHDIAAYYITTKIFGLFFFVYSSTLHALWPVFAESIAKCDWGLVRRYCKKYIALGLVFMFVSTVSLIWLMPVAVGMIAPKESIVIPLGFILLLGVYHMIRVWTDTFAVILLSINNLNPFFIYTPIQAILCIVLQWILVPVYGLYGVVLGLIGSFVLTVIWAIPMAVQKNYKLHQQLPT